MQFQLKKTLQNYNVEEYFFQL